MLSSWALIVEKTQDKHSCFSLRVSTQNICTMGTRGTDSLLEALVNEELRAAKQNFTFEVMGQGTDDVWKLRGKLTNRTSGILLCSYSKFY